MAYMSQEIKKSLSIGINNVLNKYNVKGTISIQHMMILKVTLRSGKIDFSNLGELIGYSVNEHSINKNASETQKNFFVELFAAMNGNEEYQNHNNTDVYTDYFDIGWHISLDIGAYNKAYVYKPH